MGNCKIDSADRECGLRHHQLLHGSTVKFCNLACVHQSLRCDVTTDSFSSNQDIDNAKSGQNVLMQIQYVEVRGRVNQATVF